MTRKKSFENPKNTVDSSSEETAATATAAETIETSAQTAPASEPTETPQPETKQTMENTKNTAKTDRTFAERNAADVSASGENRKKSGSGLAVLAILIALGLGGAGYYAGQQQVEKIQQKLTALEEKMATSVSDTAAELPNFDQERAALKTLSADYQRSQEQITQLESGLAASQTALKGLKDQVTSLSNSVKNEPSDWILSEADFLLGNALRKLVLDNDVDTAIALLKVAAEGLDQVSDPRVMKVKVALNNDLKQLLALNNVDQNAIMQRLSQLANSVEELSVLNVNFGDNPQNNDKLSDSVSDWEENLKKSADSFLNHFIRITPKNAQDRVLLAPNQEVYLRENIRLRLQIAILAVPRQQNELYKQSLEAVSTWVRSYFDTSTQIAENFLKEIDELADQSIYVDVPHKLSSLTLLDELLNRQTHDLKPIAIEADKSLTEENQAAQTADDKAQAPKDAAESAAQPNGNAEEKEAVEPDPQPESSSDSEPQGANDKQQ